ncbi:MAG: diguanylate cyclase [Syntrophales bacterium]|nr:diguanylate cyclase [Syntrophales bacterium]
MKENGLKRRLTVIISYVFIVPSLVVFYILFEQQVTLSTRNVILYLLIAALAIIGIILVHYVFDAISTIADFLKKASEGGEKLSLSLQHETEELNEISASFNTLIDRIEKTSEALRQAKEALQESEGKYRNILEQIEEGYYEADLAGNFTFFSTPISQILGYPAEELDGMNYRQYMSKEDSEKLFQEYRGIYQTGTPKINLDTTLVKKDGAKVYVEISVFLVRDSSGQPAGFRGIIRDISVRKRMEEELKESVQRYRQLSIIDDLTQLYNSRYFYNQLQKEIDRVDRYGHPLILLLLDLDDFKQFNDLYGHIEGDKALLRFGQVLKGCLRQTDSAYRYGGEEFTVIMPVTSIEAGAIAAERVRSKLKEEIFSPVPGKQACLTVSIGLAQYRSREDIKAFVNRVDRLMYEAKKNGKDRIYLESSSPEPQGRQ